MLARRSKIRKGVTRQNSICLRLSDDEHEIIKEAAKLSGQTKSTYIVNVVLRAAQRVVNKYKN